MAWRVCTWLYYFIVGSIAFLYMAPCIANTVGIPLYHKDLQPEHKEKLAEEIIRYRNADNLWDVLREEFTLSHYEDHPAVRSRINWYMNNQGNLLNTALRAAPYLYYILQQAKQRHLPAELVLLPIIESNYNPFVTSNAGASGIWQMMPDTASGFGIKQDRWYDGRRDIIASTRAALNYLAYLRNFFNGNWLLAIAAYNTGEGNVLTAIKRNIKDGKRTDFWTLPLAQQTRDYVPRLLALAVIISHPNQYPVYLPPVRNAPYLAEVDLGKQISLKQAAAFAGMSFTRMKQLNPGLKLHSTAKLGTYKLVLPLENIEQFTESLSHARKLLALNETKINKKSKKSKKISAKNEKNKKQISKQLMIAKNEKSKETLSTTHKQSLYTLQPGDTVYMIKKKDTITKIATRFKMAKEDILAVNQIKNNQLTVGKKLIIPTHSTIKVGDTIYVVRPGDTIEKIAKKYHVSPAEILNSNFVNNHSLMAGAKLIIPTHLII